MLAGGRSRRFGADKLNADLAGITVLDHVVASMRAAGASPVAIVGGDRRRASASMTAGDAWIPDAFDDGGPIAGILAALEWAPRSVVVVVAGDTPLVSPDTLIRLADQALVGGRPAHAAGGHGPEPLVAAWPAACRDEVRDACDRGERSPRQILARMEATPVVVDLVETTDVDEPDDLAAVADLMRVLRSPPTPGSNDVG